MMYANHLLFVQAMYSSYLLPQTPQTAYTLYLDRLIRAIPTDSVPARPATVQCNVFLLTSHGHLLHSGVKFNNF